jgi:hypothetical protein
VGQINVDWYRAGPEVFAKADRMRRQIGALSQLAGVPGAMTQRYGQFQQGEDAASANEAELTARLGGAVTQAQQAGASESGRDPSAMDAMSPGAAGATPPAPMPGTGSDQPLPVTQPGPGKTGTYVPGAITEEKLSDPGSLVSSQQGKPTPGESNLSRYGRMGAAMLFGASIPQPGRATRIGQLKGQEENRLDRLNAARAMSPLLRYSADPSKAWNDLLPEYATRDVGRIVPGQFRNPNPTVVAQAAAAEDDPDGPAHRALKNLQSLRPTFGAPGSTTVTQDTPIDPTTGNPPGPDYMPGFGPPLGKRRTVTKGAPGGAGQTSLPTPGRGDKRTGDIAAKMKAIFDANPPR